MGVVSHPPPSYIKDDDQNYQINQLDGNISLNSSIISTDDLNDPVASPDSESSTGNETIADCDRHTIPIQVGFRPMRETVQRPPPSWITIRRDNKKVSSSNPAKDNKLQYEIFISQIKQFF